MIERERRTSAPEPSVAAPPVEARSTRAAPAVRRKAADPAYDTPRAAIEFPVELSSTRIRRASGAATSEESVAGGGDGRPLPMDVRTKMESRFDADFSAVRIHEGARSAAVDALAYTRGTDIYFAPGAYSPDNERGRELLGHELAHVVQQGGGRVAGQRVDGP